MVDEAKAKGNAAFYSAYASLHKYIEALADAKKTVELKPDQSKGDGRLGTAHVGLSQYDDAIAAYKKRLKIDPNNEPLKSGLADV